MEYYDNPDIYFNAKEKRMKGYVYKKYLLNIAKIAIVGWIVFTALVTLLTVMTNYAAANQNYKFTHSGYAHH